MTFNYNYWASYPPTLIENGISAGGWSLLLLFLIISTLIILVNGGSNYVNWLLCAVPLTAFHAAAYYFPPGRIFPPLLHWILFIYAIYVNYWT